MTISATSKKAAFISLTVINFMTMFLICGVGVYGYAVAGYFDNVASVGMVFTLESVLRCVAIPISGKLSDQVGHRQLFLSALFAYIVSYAIAAFSVSFWMFTIARAVSGFAWGLFVSNVFVLISDLFGQEEAPKYSGISQAFTTTAMIVSSPITGILCSINWRLQFYVSLPILLIAAVICFFTIPNIPKNTVSGKKMDLGGCVATFVILIPFSFAMNWGPSYGWTSPLLLALIAVTVAGLLFLIFAERRADDPIYPAKLLGNRYYLSIFMVGLLYSLGNAVNNYAPTYVQYVLGYSSTVSGFITTPALVIAAILSGVLGNYAAKHGRYKGMTIFWAVATIIGGILYWVMTGVSVPLLGLTFIVLASTVSGMVNGVQQIVPYTYPMKVLKPEELAGGMAFMGVGGALGNTIASGVYGALLAADPSMSTIFRIPVLCGVCMLVFALLFRDISGDKTI